MILGYTIIEPDEGQNMFDNIELGECAKYSNIYDLNIIDPEFKVKRKKYNISSTYDGFTIVSEKFKQFCASEKYSGLIFISLPKASGYYWFKINNLLEYDTKRRGTEFLNYNSVCKGYEEIIGADPVCLKNKMLLPDGFFRTDVCFGSYSGKSPLYLVGDVTKKKLINGGFNEIFYQKILDRYDWEKDN